MASKTRRVEFKLDEAKMLNIGGGSVTSFCEQYNIDRLLMYSVKNKSHVKPNTKSYELVSKLINLGVGKYINVNPEDNIS